MLFDREALEACVVGGRRELPTQAGVAYSAFVDSSGGSDESMALSIAHRDLQGRAIIDALREWPAPFDPSKSLRNVPQSSVATTRPRRHGRSLRCRVGGLGLPPARHHMHAE